MSASTLDPGFDPYSISTEALEADLEALLAEVYGDLAPHEFDAQIDAQPVRGVKIA